MQTCHQNQKRARLNPNLGNTAALYSSSKSPRRCSRCFLGANIKRNMAALGGSTEEYLFSTLTITAAQSPISLCFKKKVTPSAGDNGFSIGKSLSLA